MTINKYLFIMLISVIGFVSVIWETEASLNNRVFSNKSFHTQSLIKNNHNIPLIYIESDKVIASYPDYIIFSGNVIMRYYGSKITADEVQITQYQNKNRNLFHILTATGNVTYSNQKIVLKGTKAWCDLNTKDIEIYQGSYYMKARQGRGTATSIKHYGNNHYTILKNGSFTSCLPGDNSWSVFGTDIIHNYKKQISEIWNAHFKISKVPMFYIPYLQIPMGSRRQSALLFPYAKYGSRNGFGMRFPYFFKLTPNFDIIVSPTYMSKRGTFISTEFHYIEAFMGSGALKFSWFPQQKDPEGKYIRNRCWLLRLHHQTLMEKTWHFNLIYDKMSDWDCFYDLDSYEGRATDYYVTQNLFINFANKNWNTYLSYRGYRLSNTQDSAFYRAAPRLHLTYYKNSIGPFNLKVLSQVDRFTNVSKNFPKTIRLHIEPTLTLPLVSDNGSLNTEFKISATHYQQHNVGLYNRHNSDGFYLKTSVNRVLPKFKTDLKMLFRFHKAKLFDYKYTIEPHLQYLYVPYRNQNNIGIYDTAFLPINYSNLFSDQIYSGLDRIPFTKRVTSGITATLYDHKYTERFITSVGQIYNFSNVRFQPIAGRSNNFHYKNPNVIWGGESCWRINNNWESIGGLQYDVHINSVSLGDISLEYRNHKTGMLKINYHYTNPKYIEHLLSRSRCSAYCSPQQRGSQFGLQGKYLLTNNWSMVGECYYDAKAGHFDNQKIYLQYKTCCWGINIGYERKTTDYASFLYNSKRYDNRVLCSVELRGLHHNSSGGSYSNFNEMLES